MPRRFMERMRSAVSASALRATQQKVRADWHFASSSRGSTLVMRESRESRLFARLRGAVVATVVQAPQTNMAAHHRGSRQLEFMCGRAGDPSRPSETRPVFYRAETIATGV